MSIINRQTVGLIKKRVMARSVKIEEHTVKRNEILDVAQKLVYTKGYDQVSIQDILDKLKISKGAFYHYFGSKQALLEALIECIYREVERLLLPIVHDPKLAALEKLRLFFATSAHWKTAHKDYLLALLRGWYADENALFRQKMTAMMLKRATPMLTQIIQQGAQEGTFNTPYPDQIAEVLYSMMQGFGDTIADFILSLTPASAGAGPGHAGRQQQDPLRRAQGLLTAYTDALERVLGAPKGSLELMDANMLEQWVVSPQENHDVSIVSNGKGN